MPWGGLLPPARDGEPPRALSHPSACKIALTRVIAYAKWRPRLQMVLENKSPVCVQKTCEMMLTNTSVWSYAVYRAVLYSSLFLELRCSEGGIYCKGTETSQLRKSSLFLAGRSLLRMVYSKNRDESTL